MSRVKWTTLLFIAFIVKIPGSIDVETVVGRRLLCFHGSVDWGDPAGLGSAKNVRFLSGKTYNVW
jgi:hypothetical protein